MSPELEEQLYKKYPKIFRKEEKDNPQHAMSYGFQHEDGWFDLIDKLCGFIQSYIDNNWHFSIEQVVAQSVKQKFAGLRFTVSGGDEFIGGAILFAEHLSFSICERCGVNNAKSFNDGGYYWTACDECKNKKDVV